MGVGGSAFQILTAKPARKRPLGTRMRGWEDNVEMDKEMLVDVNTRN